MVVVWIALAVISGVLVVGAVGRFLWSLRPQPEMSGLPTTPLERLSWAGLGITAGVGIGLAVLVAFEGATGVFEDSTSLIFWILILSGIGAWFIAWRGTKRHSGAAVVDERDRAILARSLSVESLIVLLSLVTWMIVLTEVYSDEGFLPIAYIQLIFWSTFIGGLFGRTLGIIMGYHREIPVDA